MRRQRGLSQAGLAHPELSDSYVSLIESGKRTPTPAVLELLAEKLDCSVSYLVNGVTSEQLSDLQLALRYASLTLENGEVEEARRRFAELLDDDMLGGLPDLLEQAEYGYALALEACGDLRGAIERLQRQFDAYYGRAAAGDEPAQPPQRVDGAEAERRMRIAVALCRCRREAGDLTEGVRAGEHAMAVELAGGWSDPLVELGATLASVYHKRGDQLRTMQLVGQLLEAAEELGTHRARVAACWNAATLDEDPAGGERIIALAERALALQAETGEVRNLARLRQAYGKLLLRVRPDEPERARDVLAGVERELAETSASAATRARCSVELAKAELAVGEPEHALRSAQKAVERADAIAPVIRADAYIVMARALLMLGKGELAAEAAANAGGVLRDVPPSRPCAQAWLDLAETLDLMRDHTASTESYQRALACVGL
nr:helix-turn-helix transcriptional regulator [Bailinhaonella thermotolerans]